MPKEKIFVYGSLRKGMYNYEAFKNGLDYKKTVEVEGFDMYSLAAYPYVVPSDGGKIKVDIMEATQAAKDRIDRMEHGAGYISKEIEVEGEKGTIYIFTQPRSNNDKVEHGDWVKYKTT